MGILESRGLKTPNYGSEGLFLLSFLSSDRLIFLYAINRDQTITLKKKTTPSEAPWDASLVTFGYSWQQERMKKMSFFLFSREIERFSSYLFLS